ncbi:MAG: fluoride efflux transporter CrcB [Planctomycetes bacterium]|nr:fluoride efflux transporter CrcB [Planctomycetota bacterium]MBI3834064.1 fluoride efflux transporter CrcB [Planctomycetota bacterium]
MKLFLIGLGSAVGGLLRYLVAGLMQRATGATFPIGTLIVNLSGCLVMGMLGQLLAGRLMIREEYRLALTVGLCGGYTTFSSFGWETLSLLNDGQVRAAFTNVLATNILGLLAVWAGYHFSERVFGA